MTIKRFSSDALIFANSTRRRNFVAMSLLGLGLGIGSLLSLSHVAQAQSADRFDRRVLIENARVAATATAPPAPPAPARLSPSAAPEPDGHATEIIPVGPGWG